MVFHFFYFWCAKICMYAPYEVNPLDLCLVRTIVVGAWNTLQIMQTH